MSIQKDIQELLEAHIIGNETAEKIKDYYENKQTFSVNKLLIVFGIFGAVLVGLGIILIIAHNWDELPKMLKTLFAFIPLLAGQIICARVILKKDNNTAWVESSAAFLFFALGASISLVSQIYHIEGELSSFILTWMLLILPAVYLLKSSIISLLYIIGITYYACETAYWTYTGEESIIYWLLLSAIMPYYYILYKKKPDSNFMNFHNWLIPISLVISLGILAHEQEQLMQVSYMSMFGLFILTGNLSSFKSNKIINKGYLIVGSLGTMGMLLFLSFNFFWEDLNYNNLQFLELIMSAEFISIIIFSGLASYLLFKQKKESKSILEKPEEYTFLLFILIFIVGIFTDFAVILVNILVFAIGIATIYKGAKKDNLGILNYGLLIISALITCRFFDTDLNFVLRGLLFITVGAGFFIANYRMLKNRKNDD